MDGDAQLLGKALEYGVLGLVAIGLWLLYRAALTEVRTLNASRVEDLKAVSEVVGGNTKAMVEWTASQTERNRAMEALARATEANARAVEQFVVEARASKTESEDRWRRIETELARLTSSEARMKELRDMLGRGA